MVEDIRIKSELVPNKEEFEGQLGIASFDPNEDVSTTYSFKFYTYTKEDLKINKIIARPVKPKKTRKKAVLIAPNCGTAIRIKRKLAHHIAASNNKRR